jgi:hypothetical protein
MSPAWFVVVRQDHHGFVLEKKAKLGGKLARLSKKGRAQLISLL